MNSYDHFLEICQEHGIRPTAVLRKAGLSTGLIGAWKQGNQPKGYTAQRVAQTLGITVDELLTDDLTREPSQGK